MKNENDQMKNENDQTAATIDVSVCRHGCAHVRFGATTIHLSADEFRLFMRAGMQALHEMGPERTADGHAVRN